MIITTNRLTLRHFCLDDAPAVYNLASNPNVALATGFVPHDSIQTSQLTLQNILINDYTWAVTLGGKLIGCIGRNQLDEHDHQRQEIGYWLGQQYWGNGYIPEATAVLAHYMIYTLGIDTVWCAYSDTNDKSHAVQDKCHFVYHHTLAGHHNKLLDITTDMHYTTLTKAILDKYPAPQYTVSNN